MAKVGARITVEESVRLDFPKGMSLCFQRCTYIHSDGRTEGGFRFVWEKDGKRLPEQGQALIPNAGCLRHLIDLAEAAGWFYLPPGSFG
jgi:hypothetical protein